MPAENKYLDIPFEIKLENISEDGTFDGWGSLFDNVPDSHRDLVARGAFAESLSAGGRNKTGIAMLWQHRSDKIPGVWLELREDPKGLYVKGQLALETELGKETYELMKLGASTGMWKFSLSIGFDTLEYEMQNVKVGDADIKVRLIKKASLWEISIVTFPAKLGASVMNIKKIDIDQIKDIDNERDLEKILRESGLSKCAAQYVVKQMKPGLREAEPEIDNGVLSGILDDLKEVNQGIQTVGILNSLKEINL